MSSASAVIGFLLGMSFGMASVKSGVQKRLREFVAARNLRLVDGAGADVPVDQLASALKKG